MTTKRNTKTNVNVIHDEDKKYCRQEAHIQLANQLALCEYSLRRPRLWYLLHLIKR